MFAPKETGYQAYSNHTQFFLNEVYAITGDSPLYRAFERVPREAFVPDQHKDIASLNKTVSLGWEGAVLDRPVHVAEVLSLVDLRGRKKVLEVGTGSGYVAAVLAHLAGEVHTIECIEVLAEDAQRRMSTLNLDNVYFHVGDGAKGIEKEAPFDVIIVSACAQSIPLALVEQLRAGGEIVLPVGKNPNYQMLVIGEKSEDGLRAREVQQVSFYPLISDAPGGWKSMEAFKGEMTTRNTAYNR